MYQKLNVQIVCKMKDKEEKRELIDFSFTIKIDKPIKRFEVEETEKLLLLDFLDVLCKNKYLEYTTKIDSNGIMSMEFNMALSKLVAKNEKNKD